MAARRAGRCDRTRSTPPRPTTCARTSRRLPPAALRVRVAARAAAARRAAGRAGRRPRARAHARAPLTRQEMLEQVRERLASNTTPDLFVLAQIGPTRASAPRAPRRCAGACREPCTGMSTTRQPSGSSASRRPGRRRSRGGGASTRVHAARHVVLPPAVRPLDARVPLLRPAADRRAGGHVAAHRARRRPGLAGRRARVDDRCRSAATSSCSTPSSCAGRPAQADGGEAYQVTMAALAATRAVRGGRRRRARAHRLGAAPVGHVAPEVADRTITFLVLQYAIYMASLVIFGLGLLRDLPRAGAVRRHGRAGDLRGRSRSSSRWRSRSSRPICSGGWTPSSRGAGASRASRSASRTRRRRSRRACASALDHVRRNDPALAGALVFWGCNIGTLWAAFHAFGDAPSIWVIVDGRLGRDARQPAPAARAASAAWTAR